MRPPPSLESGQNAGIRASLRTIGITTLKPFSLQDFVRGSRESQRSAHSPNLGVDAST